MSYAAFEGRRLPSFRPTCGWKVKAMEHSTHDFGPNSVTVRQSAGGWEVIIIEDGGVEIREFVTEHFADNFAVGQMVRMNLDRVNKVAPEQTGR